MLTTIALVAAAAAPHASSVAAHLEFTGRAQRGAVVPIVVQCELGGCLTTAVAGRNRRYRATLDVVLPQGATTVSVSYGEQTAEFALELPAYAAASPYSDDARVPEVNVVGDSLAVGADAPLRAQLPGWKVTTSGVEGRSLAAGMALLAQTPLPRRPRALAFSLFTNDDPRGVDAFEAAVRASLDRLHRRDCAVWATIVRPPLAGVSYGAANARLRALALEDPRLLVVDWARAVRGNRKWLTRDRVHPTTEGYAARARLYANAARACVGRVASVP